MADETTGARGRPPRVFAVVLFLYGAGLAGPGGFLVSLGGTSFYLIAGIACIGCAILLWRGDGRGVSLYALLLVATLIWGILESGRDGWALLPRIGIPILLGLWLLAPWAQRGLRAGATPARWIIGVTSLAGIALVLAGVMSPSYGVPPSAQRTGGA